MRMDQEFFTFRVQLHRLEFNVQISSELTIELVLKIGKDQVQTQQDLRFSSQTREMELDECISLTVPLYLNANNKKRRGEDYQQRMATLEINTISLAKSIRRSIGIVKFDVSKYVCRSDREVYECFAIEKSDYEGKVSFTLDHEKDSNDISQDTSDISNPFGNSLTVSQTLNPPSSNKSPNIMGKSWNSSRQRNTTNNNTAKITKIPMVNQPSKSPGRGPLVSSYSNTKSVVLPSQSLLVSQSRTPTSRKSFFPEVSGVSYKNLVELQEKNRQLDSEKQGLMDTMSQNIRVHSEIKKELSDLQKARDSKDDVIDGLQTELTQFQQVQQMNQQLLTDLGIQQVAFQTISSFYNEDFDHMKLHSLVERIQKDLVELQGKESSLQEAQSLLSEAQSQVLEMTEKIENLEYQTGNQKRKQQQDEEYASQVNSQCITLTKYNKELVEKQIDLEQQMDTTDMAHEKKRKSMQEQIETLTKELAEARKFENTYQDLYKSTKNKLGVAINLIFEEGNESLMEKVEAIVLD